MLKRNNWVRILDATGAFTHGQVIAANDKKAYVNLANITRTWRGVEATTSTNTALLNLDRVKQICKPKIINGEYVTDIKNESYTTCSTCSAFKSTKGTCPYCGE